MAEMWRRPVLDAGFRPWNPLTLSIFAMRQLEAREIHLFARLAPVLRN